MAQLLFLEMDNPDAGYLISILFYALLALAAEVASVDPVAAVVLPEVPHFEMEPAFAPLLENGHSGSDTTQIGDTSVDDLALDFNLLDLELVDIFVEEGKDLLDHCDGLLAELRADPEDREAVAGLQRDLHTLKGGARMAGINAKHDAEDDGNVIADDWDAREGRAEKICDDKSDGKADGASDDVMNWHLAELLLDPDGEFLEFADEIWRNDKSDDAADDGADDDAEKAHERDFEDSHLHLENLRADDECK